MSDKRARVHTQSSNREKPRDVKERDKKTVFKGTLDSPLRISWPSVPINLQNSILARISQLLEGVSESRTKKRKNRQSTDIRIQKRRKTETTTETISDAMAIDVDSSSSTEPRPTICDHLVYGINEVTKRLETQVENARFPVVFSSAPTVPTTPPLEFIFVCRADVDPPILINHIPHLVAAYNSSQSSIRLKVVPLPKGAEASLAQLLDIRRVAVLGFDQSLPDRQELVSLLEPIPTLTAPWFSKPSSHFIPTHIKHVRTTAPLDMKVTKEKRRKEKADRKAEKNKNKNRNVIPNSVDVAVSKTS